MHWQTLYPEWLLMHGPAAIVVVPLMIGVLTALNPSVKLAWATALAVTGFCAYTALGLLLKVFGSGPIVYDMGNWPAPIGIVYRIDALNAPFLLLIPVIGFLCTLFALRSVAAEIEPRKRVAVYAAFIVSFAGLMGMCVTGDAFNVFVFLEISSLSTYALVAMGASRDQRALSSAFNYLIMGSIGATFFVIGLGLLLMQTGTLNMADIARVLHEQGGGSRVTHLAFAFIMVGFGLKLAMFPLHSWLPGAYSYAPSFFTAFLAATATKAAIYLMLRFTFTIFDPNWDFVARSLNILLVGVAVMGMLFASLQAIFQTDMRRTLAFSSVAQVGYILLGVGIATTLGVQAGVLHVFNHAMTKAALFLAVGAFWYRFGITRVSDLRGIGQTMPLTTIGFTLAGLSLIGVPGTVGFVSKLALLQAAAANGWWWAVGVIVASSIMALVYIGKMLEQAWLQPAPVINGKPVARNEAPLTMLIPLWVLALSCWYFGINADWTTFLAHKAAEVLSNGPIILQHLPDVMTNPDAVLGGH